MWQHTTGAIDCRRLQDIYRAADIDCRKKLQTGHAAAFDRRNKLCGYTQQGTLTVGRSFRIDIGLEALNVGRNYGIGFQQAIDFS